MYFALDFGGTNFRISWTTSLEEIDVVANTLKIKNTGSYGQDSAQIMDIMRIKSLKAKGIVVALPGHFDHQKMVLERANNLKVWINKPFFKLLRPEFDCDLIIDKDSSVAAIGESINNALKEREFLYITWGTGIGGCIVASKDGYLPEVKELIWENTFRQIEVLCGGEYAGSNYGVELKYLDSGQQRVLIKNFVNEVEKICSDLGLRFIVLGGGITDKREDIISAIQKALKKSNIKLVKSQLGDFSAIYGGYALLRSRENDIDLSQSLRN